MSQPSKDICIMSMANAKSHAEHFFSKISRLLFPHLLLFVQILSVRTTKHPVCWIILLPFPSTLYLLVQECSFSLWCHWSSLELRNNNAFNKIFPVCVFAKKMNMIIIGIQTFPSPAIWNESSVANTTSLREVPLRDQPISCKIFNR